MWQEFDNNIGIIVIKRKESQWELIPPVQLSQKYRITISKVQDIKEYSCMNIYAYSCLKLLSNRLEAAFKQEIHVQIMKFMWRLNMVFI